ncbi:MAG: metallophosphoesterase, partial [Promethearchaeota archaeon]
MKILYITDLHGIRWKYERVFHEAKFLNVDMVINGGDMLPFKGNLLHQDKFITGFLDDYFSKFESSGLYFACQLGNDDCIIFDELFQGICNKYSYVINLAQKRFQIKHHSYEFIGMNWVTDLPFGLKDRARMDNRDFTLPKQIGKQYISN